MNKDFGMARKITLALAIVLAVFLTGCQTYKSGTVMSDEDKAEIIKGKTTQTELQRKFGNPDQTNKINSHTVEISYIQKNFTPKPFGGLKYSNVEYWFEVVDGVIQDFGDRPTKKFPNESK